MKKINIFYWIITGLFAAFMLFAGFSEIQNGPDSVKLMTQLSYGNYMAPFLGVTKILGVIAILIPGFPRIKEWAYAGFVFDFIGATYSMIAIGLPISNWSFMIVPFAFVIGSYMLYHKRLNAGR